MNYDVQSMFWKKFLNREKAKPYFKNIINLLLNKEQKIIYPENKNIFKVFNLEPEKIKVVLIGQDPYHGEGQANGLAFSVNDGVATPPSLLNIYKELKNELDIEIPTTGNLNNWFNNGVFLINTILTVEKAKPLSHKDKGWETLFENAIQEINKLNQPIVYLLLGRNARNYKYLITNKKHLILETTHPSPFSAHYGFLGSGIFLKANKFLIENGYKEWEINKLWKIV